MSTILDVAPRPAVESKATVEVSRRSPLRFVIFAVALLAFAVFASGLTAGFLLDDQFHLHYLYQAFNGQPEQLWRKFFANWSFSSDSLTSYRPLISLSLAFDYAVWKTNSIGYHLTNVAMFAGCCALVSLLCWELGGLYKTARKGLVAFFAGALFACYPLHPEAVTWIIGRVDVQSTLLYLASMLMFLKSVDASRQTSSAVPGAAPCGGNARTILSILLFIGALASKEMAVTLPAVLTLGSFILFDRNDQTAKFARRISMFYWCALAGFAAWRTAVLGTVVGGYGAVGKESLVQITRNFTDKVTFMKVLFGSNDELGSFVVARALALTSIGTLSLLGAFSVFRLPRTARLFGFLLLWSLITIAPTFQIWHINPNLVGSRLFFLGSAPLCMALAFAAVGTAARTRTVIGSLAAVVLCAAWGTTLHANLRPWAEAGNLNRVVSAQVRQLAGEASEQSPVLLINVPQDHLGAPLLGRKNYLAEFLRPPFLNVDLTNRVISTERPIPGGNEYVYPQLLHQQAAQASALYQFEPAAGRYVKISLPEEASQSILQAVPEQHRVIIDGTTFDHTIWMPVANFKPGAYPVVTIHGSQILSILNPELWWEAEDGQHTVAASIVDGGTVVFEPGRLRAWTQQSKLKRIGVHLPCGNYVVSFENYVLSSAKDIEPTVQIDHNNEVFFDASSVQSWNKRKPAHVRAFVTKPCEALPDTGWNGLPLASTIAWSKDFSELKGKFQLPPSVMTGAAARQVGVLLLDPQNKPIGVISEPRSFAP